MIRITDYELEEYIDEDIPYLDLTTHLQNVENKKAVLEIFTREDVVVSCSDDAARVAKLLGCEVDFVLASKSYAKKGETIITLSGDYNHIQKGYRRVQVLLEYSCKIATYAFEMKREIEKVNPHCELLTTRKTFPFSKKFCIKSIVTGGAMPHRLNLSETVLFFSHHRKVYECMVQFYKAIQEIKHKVPEKKIVVETESFEDAINLMKYGADVLQIDKAEVELLHKIVQYKNKHFEDIKILAAGGINKSNAKEFAKTGVDGIVTSAVYFCGMANFGTNMEMRKGGNGTITNKSR